MRELASTRLPNESQVGSISFAAASSIGFTAHGQRGHGGGAKHRDRRFRISDTQQGLQEIQ